MIQLMDIGYCDYAKNEAIVGKMPKPSIEKALDILNRQ